MRKSLAVLLLGAALPISAQQTIQVQAHRGGRAARPENTLPAFQYAIGLKVEALELDLAVTKDNVLVVSHSPYLTQPHYDDPRMTAVLANERPPLPTRRSISVPAVEHPLPSAFAMDATLRARSEGKEICLPIANPRGGTPLWIPRRPFR
jgi:glycerophosphoryl diester phosphodiesterase